MVEILQYELEGEHYLTFYLDGEIVSSFKIGRKLTNEELKEIMNAINRRAIENMEKLLLEGEKGYS